MKTTRCPAVIWHGPGHQSRTGCQLTGAHKLHKAIYGSFEQVAHWRGKKKFTGYFDEPPAYREDKQPKRPNPRCQCCKSRELYIGRKCTLCFKSNHQCRKARPCPISSRLHEQHCACRKERR